jgi:hypothetical protein
MDLVQRNMQNDLGLLEESVISQLGPNSTFDSFVKGINMK